MDPLLPLALLVLLGGAGLVLLFNNRPARTYTPSVSEIEEDETRLRAEAKRLIAQAERDDALLTAETARASLEDIRFLIQNDRRH